MSQYNDILNAVVTAVSGVGVTVEKVPLRLQLVG